MFCAAVLFLLERDNRIFDCIYTDGNENVCGKYRKIAEMLCAALHFVAESIKLYMNVKAAGVPGAELWQKEKHGHERETEDFDRG